MLYLTIFQAPDLLAPEVPFYLIHLIDQEAPTIVSANLFRLYQICISYTESLYRRYPLLNSNRPVHFLKEQSITIKGAIRKPGIYPIAF